MQWFLALICALSCGALGGVMARRALARLRLAQDWEEALSRMQSAAQQGNPLGEILRLGAGERLPVLKEAARSLALFPAQEAEEWLGKLAWDPLLLPQEKEILSSCLAGLFAPEKEGQLLSLRFAQERWRAVARRCEEEKEKNGKLYLHLGWLSGAALFILMC